MSGLTDTSLDWNLDLDDLLGCNKNSSSHSDVRRHSEPASLPSRKKSLKVQFGNVQFRECEQILGDNPGCEEGPSLSIGWKHRTRAPIKVDAWEEYRSRNGRRKQSALYLTEDQRARIAMEAGISKKDIYRNIELISYFHDERNTTLMELHKERAAAASSRTPKCLGGNSKSLRSRGKFASLDTFMC